MTLSHPPLIHDNPEDLLLNLLGLLLLEQNLLTEIVKTDTFQKEVKDGHHYMKSISLVCRCKIPNLDIGDDDDESDKEDCQNFGKLFQIIHTI